MAMLLNYKKNNLVVLASDPDFEAWTKTQEKVIHFKSTSAFTDEYLKLREHEFSGRVLGEIHKGDIAAEVREKYSDDQYFDVDSANSEIVSADIMSLNVISIEIISADSVAGIASVKIHYTGLAELELVCEVRAYDSVDKDYLYLGTNEKTGEVKVDIDVIVDLKFEDNVRTLETYKIGEIDFYAEEFEVPADWETFLDHSEHWPEEG